MRRNHGVQFFNFDGCVRDDFQKLFMRPDVVLRRRHIQIAHQHRFRAGAKLCKPVAHLVKEIEFVREFVVFLRIGFVAARRYIEIVNAHAA